MKIKILLGSLVAIFCIHYASAVIWIDSTNGIGVTNITNTGSAGSLVDYVPGISGGQSAANLLDWLNDGGTFPEGQISGYNSLTSSSLPQAGSLAFEDGNTAGSGLNGTYQFAVGSYYVAAHWGGYNTAHLLVVTDASEQYGLATKLEGVPKGGGNSVIRVWNGGTSVPDTGSTLILLGLGVGVLGFLKHQVLRRESVDNRGVR